MSHMKVLFSLTLVVILVSCGNTISSGRPNPEKSGLESPSPGDPDPADNFIIEEKLLRTEGQFQLWEVLYWSRDKKGQPVQTTAKVNRPADTSVKRPAVIFNHGGWNECTSVGR